MRARNTSSNKAYNGEDLVLLPTFNGQHSTLGRTPTASSPANNNVDSSSRSSPRRRTRSGNKDWDWSRLVPFVVVTVVTMATFQLFLNSMFRNNGVTTTSSDSFSDKKDISSNTTTATIQEQIEDLKRQLSKLEGHQPIYREDPRFFPFLIRDSRHLVPTQSSPEFHIFDYVDLSAVKQGKARRSQLFHNAEFVLNAPCQLYSVPCYRKKILQVFGYVLQNFPHVEYYFYMEADNDLCVPMNMVQALALQEERYFINVGIGFSGWIMSRQFMQDFLVLYRNITFPTPPAPPEQGKAAAAGTVPNPLEAAAATSPAPDQEQPEIRPDVLASYYLTEKRAWTVTRQYWVSHTTLESLGVSSLTVKDRRRKDSGNRVNLDKHLPRCLEPRRGKWPLGRRPLDPRDRFGWDYFDYAVCPDAVIFPCAGPDQLAQLVAEDWRVANETGAIARLEKMEERRKGIQAAAAVGVGAEGTTTSDKKVDPPVENAREQHGGLTVHDLAAMTPEKRQEISKQRRQALDDRKTSKGGLLGLARNNNEAS